MCRLCMGLVLAALITGCASVPPSPVRMAYVGNDGGLQFLIKPDDAQVSVDADYKGLARDFTGDNVLVLPRGLHAVEVRRDGYLTFFRQVQISQGLLEVMVYALPVNSEVPLASGAKPSR